jgi:hypothetical protein
MSQTLIAMEMNCETGEVTERPFTPEEVEAYNNMVAESEARRIAAEEEATSKAAAKASAEAKLAALGLTPEEIAAL